VFSGVGSLESLHKAVIDEWGRRFLDDVHRPCSCPRACRGWIPSYSAGSCAPATWIRVPAASSRRALLDWTTVRGRCGITCTRRSSTGVLRCAVACCRRSTKWRSRSGITSLRFMWTTENAYQAGTTSATFALAPTLSKWSARSTLYAGYDRFQDARHRRDVVRPGRRRGRCASFRIFTCCRAIDVALLACAAGAWQAWQLESGGRTVVRVPNGLSPNRELWLDKGCDCPRTRGRVEHQISYKT
jgi:hypothetical protein